MRKALLSLVIATACSTPVLAADKLKNFEQKLGYALGMDMAKGLQEKGLKVDIDALMQGFRDQMEHRSPKLNEQQLDELARETQRRVIAHEQAVRKKLAETNRKKEAEFFARNAKARGVVTLPEGIQYKVLVEGKGPRPKMDDTVVVHYKGMLLNGKVFDSSYARGKPMQLKIDQVIKGWQIILPKMRMGAKWKVWIPAKLAYGERGAGKVIGPDEPLVFEIELLNILPHDKGSSAQ